MSGFLNIITGMLVLCQSSSTESGSCPGDDITFTCVTSTTAIVWIVAPDGGDQTTCVVITDVTMTAMCGPMNRFTATVTGADSTTLTVQSVDDVINGTRVECVDSDVDEQICITGLCWHVLYVYNIIIGNRC